MPAVPRCLLIAIPFRAVMQPEDNVQSSPTLNYVLGSSGRCNLLLNLSRHITLDSALPSLLLDYDYIYTWLSKACYSTLPKGTPPFPAWDFYPC